MPNHTRDKPITRNVITRMILALIALLFVLLPLLNMWYTRSTAFTIFLPFDS